MIGKTAITPRRIRLFSLGKPLFALFLVCPLVPPRLITMNRSLIFPSGLAFCLVLSAAFGQEQLPSGYDSAKLPKGRDYFE